MSGLAWLILDGLLVAATVAGALKAITSKPPRPLPASRLEAAPGGEKVPRETKVVSLLPAAPEEALPAKASLEDLWRKTLFLPARQEVEPEEKEALDQAAIAAAMDKNFEFELVGIAQITPVDKPPVPVAVLRGRQSGGNANRSGNARGNANRRAPGGRQEPETPPAPGALAKPTKLLFREGDPINDTGYLLKAIYPEKKMVEVTRGSQTIQLHINYAGSEAARRREAQVEATAKKRQAQEQERQNSIRQKQADEQRRNQAEQKERDAANPGQPPPPPGQNGDSPAPAQLPADNAPQDDRTEQIRQQVEQNAQQQQSPARAPRRSVRPGNR
ncbi:MAG: hypothetical protein ACI4SG_01275 [Oligosphaeraceae bacterium]